MALEKALDEAPATPFLNSQMTDRNVLLISEEPPSVRTRAIR